MGCAGSAGRPTVRDEWLGAVDPASGGTYWYNPATGQATPVGAPKPSAAPKPEAAEELGVSLASPAPLRRSPTSHTPESDQPRAPGSSGGALPRPPWLDGAVAAQGHTARLEIPGRPPDYQSVLLLEPTGMLRK